MVVLISTCPSSINFAIEASIEEAFVPLSIVKKNAGITRDVGQCPNITGTYTANYLTAKNDQAEATGSLVDGGKQSGKLGTSGADGKANVIVFDASRSSSLFGKATTLQPRSGILLVCIKT